MKIFEYLKENKSSMRSGLPIELRDIIDERSVYDGSYEGMIEFLERPGLEHVRNARFIIEDVFNEENKIVLLYVKDIKEYDDFDLRQFAYKMKRLEAYEASFDNTVVLETKSLASRLNDFYKDFDFYNYMDSVDGAQTEEDLIEDLVEQLWDLKAVNGILEFLKDIKENGEPDKEQLQVLEQLIEDVEKVQVELDRPLDEVLTHAVEKSVIQYGNNNVSKDNKDLADVEKE